MKIKIIGLLALLTVGCASMAVGQSFTVGSVTGVVAEGDSSLMLTGQEITFNMRLAAGPSALKGITNAFRIYSPDGATWDTTTIDTVIPRGSFDLLWVISSFSADGAISDTVGLAGAVMFNPFGIAANFDDVTHTITIGPIDPSDEGKHICIDSSWWRPSGVWKWITPNVPPEVYPAWDGPHCYLIDADGTDVSRLGDNLPTEWSLGQNYPNPFNPTTEIAFDVPSRSHVTLAVYNVLGQHVTNLVDDTYAAGHYSADWDGTSQGGSSVASGVYFYRIETENYVETKKMMLLK